MSRLKKYVPELLIVALFVILLTVRIGGISSREQLHSDEIYSAMLSQCNPAYSTALPKDTIMTGADVKAKLVTEHNLGQDLSSLYNNSGDVPHASLYYMALRFALVGFDTFDAGELALRGGLLNLLFFAITFIALRQTCRLLFEKGNGTWMISLAVLAIAFGTRLSVDNTLLVREYQMAEMFICLMVWASASICANAFAGVGVKFKQWMLYTLAIAGVLSTGYLNAVFVALLSVAMSLVMLLVRCRRMIIPLIVSPICGLVVAVLIYRGYFNFLLHSTVHTTRAFESFGGVLNLVFVRALTTNGLAMVGMVVLAATLIVALCGKNRRDMFSYHRQWWIPLIALLTMVVVEYASLLRAERYVYPFVATAALLTGVIMYGLKDSWRQIASVFFVVFVVSMALIKPLGKNYNWELMADQLSRGAVFYNFNANELPQVAPVLNDTVSYRLVNTPEVLARVYPPVVINGRDTMTHESSKLPLVSRITPPMPSQTPSTSLTGPLKIYLVKLDTLRQVH